MHASNGNIDNIETIKKIVFDDAASAHNREMHSLNGNRQNRNYKEGEGYRMSLLGKVLTHAHCAQFTA